MCVELGATIYGFSISTANLLWRREERSMQHDSYTHTKYKALTHSLSSLIKGKINLGMYLSIDILRPLNSNRNIQQLYSMKMTIGYQA